MSIEYKDKLHELLSIIQNDSNNMEIVYECLADINALMTPILTELDENDFFLWGLSHYSIPSEPTLNASIKFEKSLQLNPDYLPARLYLGHCHNDKKEWYEALEEYLKVDQEELRDSFDIWIIAKLNEQIGFCYWQINQKDEAMRFFEMLVNIWVENNENDSFIKPEDMIECLGIKHKLLENINISKMI